MIAVLDTQRISLTCFIAPAVDEFNYNASKLKLLLECFCEVQASFAKPRQRALCLALCQTHRPWRAKEGDCPACSGRGWDGFGPLRTGWCLGLVGWL